MKRMLSFLLALCLLASPLSALAESAPANPAAPAAPVNPAGGAQLPVVEVADAEALSSLRMSVEYDEAAWDGMLSAKFTVSWAGTETVKTAKDVRVSVELFDGLELVAGETLFSLGDIEAGGQKTFALELKFDRTVEKPDKVPEPKLIVTAWADAVGYTRYTALMDGTTEPRALVLGWETTDAGPRAVQADVDMMADIFSQSYYNTRPVETESYCNEISFESAMGCAAGWDTDENDVSYIYINAHGAAIDDVPVPAFFADTANQSVQINGSTYNNQDLVTFENLLSCLDQTVEGRVVLITEVCYSGQLMSVAASLGLDAEKFSIMTAAQASKPSILWPDRFDLNDLDTTGKLLGWVDLPEVDALFSYGWFTNDLCDLLDAGYVKDENGVVTIGSAYNYLHDESYALSSRMDSILKDKNEENLIPTDISGLDDVFDTMDAWGERLQETLAFSKLNPYLVLDKLEPLDALKQWFMILSDMVNPAFQGNGDTLLYCSNASYDNEERKLVVVDEQIEYMSALELYYAYLREWVVPDIGMARREDPIVGDSGYDAKFWADLLYLHGASGLMSAVVCDLDKNGSMDMITLTVNPREQALIEATDIYYSVNLEMYQIENGQVVRSDVAEDIILVNEKHRSCWCYMTFWMNEYDGKITFYGKGYYTEGLSYDGGMSFSCGFESGKITAAPEQPSLFSGRYMTEDGRNYEILSSSQGEYRHMGDGVAFLENEGSYHYTVGYLYDAIDYTSLYEYIYGYAEPKVYEPMKLLLRPEETASPAELRKEAVKAGINQSVSDAMAAMGAEAYSYSVSCDRNTGEATQVIIYSNKIDYSAVDTEKLRAMGLAVLNAPEVAASGEAVSAMENFEFSKKRKEKTAGSCMITFMMIPDGTYALVLDLDE